MNADDFSEENKQNLVTSDDTSEWPIWGIRI